MHYKLATRCLTLLFSVFTFSQLSTAQCDVEASADRINVPCGTIVTLSAIGEGKIAFSEDFNSGSLSGWDNTPSGSIGTFCGVPSPDGTPYLWFDGSANSPRYAATPPLDLREGGSVCFWMRYSARENPPTCEDPDAPDEGVHLQYRKATGGWKEIKDWDPMGGGVTYLTSWAEYCVPIPADAMEDNVQIRWLQVSNTQDLTSGNYLDHWGIEDVSIEVNKKDSKYKWSHTGIEKATSETDPVQIISDTMFSVLFTTGAGDACTDNVTITVEKGSVSVTADNTNICPGDVVQLTGDHTLYKLPPVNGCDVTEDLTCGGTPQTVTANIGGPKTTDNSFQFMNSQAACRVQYIYTKNQLINSGVKPGKITEIGLQGNLDLTYSDDVNYSRNFTIKMGCASKVNFDCCDNNDFVSGLTVVYNPKNKVWTNGWNMMPLDYAFEWDGTDHIIIEMCYNNPNDKWTHFALQVNDIGCCVGPVYEDYTTFSDNSICNSTSGFERYARPVTRFTFCEPSYPPMDWVWSPDNSTYTPNNDVKDPQVEPASSQLYTLKAKLASMPDECFMSDDVMITVSDLSALAPTSNSPLCEGEELQLKANIPGMVSYSWTGPGAFNSTSANDDVTRAGVLENASYEGTYSVTVNDGTCTATKTVEVDVVSSPNPGVGTDITTCSNADPFELFDQLAGEDGGGQWIDAHGSGGLSGSTFVPENVAPSKLPNTFDLIYRVENSPCPQEETTVKVTVEKSPYAGEDTEYNVCADAGAFSLFDVLGIFADPGGVWTDMDGSGGLSGEDFDPAGLGGDTYRFEYRIAGVAPCVDDVAIVTVNVLLEPKSGTPNNNVVCVTQKTIDLYTLLSDYDGGGDWSDDDEAGGLSESIVDFTQISEELLPDSFRYTYTASLPGCKEASTQVVLGIEVQNSAGLPNEIDICEAGGLINLYNELLGEPTEGGVWTDVDNTGALENGLFDPTGLGGNTYHFDYLMESETPCLDETVTLTVNVMEQPNAGEDASAEVCVESTINLFDQLGGTPDVGGEWSGPTGGGSLDKNTGVFNTAGANAGVYVMKYKIEADDPCLDVESTVTLKVNGPPKIGSIFTDCSQNRETFIVTFFLNDGDAETYQVSPEGTIFTSSNSYSSNPIPEGESVEFILTDAKGCGEDRVTVQKDCDCISSPGSMRTDTTLQVCNGVIADGIFKGGSKDDGNDALVYYLHEGNSTQLINPIDSALLPSFSFNPENMTLGVTYYISSAIGNKDNATGFPQRTDGCFAIAEGTPVVFNALPTANISLSENVICPGTPTTLSYEGTGVNPPFTLLVSEEGNPADSIVLENRMDSILNPINTTTYNLEEVIDAIGCKSTLNQSEKVTMNVSARADIIPGVNCSASNPSFDIQFSGEGSEFEVHYTNSFDNTVTIIENITSPTITINPKKTDPNKNVIYSLDTVIDNSGSICAGVVSGSYTLHPTPTAEIVNSNATYCIGKPVDLTFNLTGLGPWTIILEEVKTEAEYTINASSYTEVVSLNTGLTDGAYQFVIQSVTDDVSGCSSVGIGAPAMVNINPGPVAEVRLADGGKLKENMSVCSDFTSVNVVMTMLKGSGNNFTIFYDVNGDKHTAQVTNGTEVVIPYTNPGNENVVVFKIDSVKDGSSSSCTGIGDQATLTINKLPTVSPVIPISEICLGDMVTMNYDVAGNGGVNFSVLENGNAIVATGGGLETNNPHTLTFTPSLDGNYSYTIVSISDGSNPACAGTNNDVLPVTVNPLPTVSFESSVSQICNGDDLTLDFTTTGKGNLKVDVFDNQNESPILSFTEPAGTYQKTLQGLSIGQHDFTVTIQDETTPSPCLGSGITPHGTPNLVVKVNDVPASVPVFTPQAAVCSGVSANLDLAVVAGSWPVTVYYTDGVASSSALSDADSDEILIQGTTTRDIIIDSLVDAIGCKTILNQPVKLTVHDLPTATLSGSPTVCLGETAGIQIDVTGKGPLTVQYQEKQYSNQITNILTEVFTAGTHTITHKVTDTTEYTIVGITDSNSPLCYNSGTGVASINIAPIPQVDFVAAESQSCAPFNVELVNITLSDYPLVNCEWSVSSGITSQVCDSLSFTLMDPGTYGVSLKVQNSLGCEAEENRPLFLTLHPDPIADFGISPKKPDIIENLVTFQNYTEGGSTYNWSIDGKPVSTMITPMYQFPDVPDVDYNLCLQAVSYAGCINEYCDIVTIKDRELIYVPNTFTPNHDDINEKLCPVVNGLVEQTSKLEIYDRWGALVYETNSFENGWDGTDKNGNKLPSGIYPYRIQAESKIYPGKTIIDYGEITLQR